MDLGAPFLACKIAQGISRALGPLPGKGYEHIRS